MLSRKLTLVLPVLALLSPLASSARWDDYRTNRNDEAYNVCANMTFGSDTNACMDVVRGRYFQSDALRTCSQQTFASDQISCMKQIADKDYDPAAVQVCQSLTFSSDTNSCMNVIANQAFDHAALRVCSGMTFSSDILNCLSRSGYQPRHRDGRDGYRDGYRDGRNRQTTTQDILVDALDQLLRDMLNGYARSQGRICSVVNSNATYLGDVSENQLVDAGSQFARSQNSCVITNVKGATRSRTFIDARGSVVADQLTEKEANSIKRRAGYSSCRIMTCELR